MIVAVLHQSVDVLEESKILMKRNNILLNIKQYINEFLDPSKLSYVDDLTINDPIKFLNIDY